jgi:hypothetical protein
MTGRMSALATAVRSWDVWFDAALSTRAGYAHAHRPSYVSRIRIDAEGN